VSRTGTTTLQNYLVLLVIVTVCVMIVMVVLEGSLSTAADNAVDNLLLE